MKNNGTNCKFEMSPVVRCDHNIDFDDGSGSVGCLNVGWHWLSMAIVGCVVVAFEWLVVVVGADVCAALG